MDIFTCSLCKKNIGRNKNIYYAFDNNYCSTSCRYIALTDNEKNIDTYKKSNYNLTSYYKEITHRENTNNTVTSIKSYKSFDNLSEKCYSDNIDISQEIKENNYKKLDDKSRICNTYLEYSITFITFMYNTFYKT